MIASFHVLGATAVIEGTETELLFQHSSRGHELSAIDAKWNFEVKARLFDSDDATEAFNHRFFFGLNGVKAAKGSETEDHDNRN